jgi:pullulanase
MKGDFYLSSSSHVITDEQNQTATFTLFYWEYGPPGKFLEGKILGDFNYWNPGNAEPIPHSPHRHGVRFDKTFGDIPPGFHQYKYFIRFGEKQMWWNSEKQEWTRNSTFLMPGIRVLSSRNFITPGGKVYFAAQLFSNEAPPEFLETPAWSVEPTTPGITISTGGILSVDSNVAVTTGDITVKATANGKTGVKKIALQEKDTSTIASSPYKVTFFIDDYGFSSGWNLWVWKKEDSNYNPWQCNFSEKSDLGMIAGINSDNFLVRRGKGDNAYADKSDDLSTQGNPETYVIGINSNQVYYEFRDAVRAATPQPKVAPIIDSKDYISVSFSYDPPTGVVVDENSSDSVMGFDLFENGNKVNGVTWKRAPGDELAVKCVFPAGHNFDPTALFEIGPIGFYKTEKTLLRRVLDNYVYQGNDMGITYTPDKKLINLRVWAPTASNVSVMTYNDYKTENPLGQETPMTKAGDSSGTWTVSLDRPKYDNQFYLYKVVFNNQQNAPHYAVDPYVNAVCVNGLKGALVDIHEADTKPSHWAPTQKPYLAKFEDAIIYEVHVRDFTIDQNSGVLDKWKGRYLGFVQGGATHPQDPKIKTGIDHLVELGITHVHLLPVYDYDKVDETLVAGNPIPPPKEYNWGYNPMNFNTPDGSYSTNPHDPKTRIVEFRQMVQGLHDRNIRVIMDGVYNHASKTENFDQIVPKYYFRTDDMGNFKNGSGCGNEIATERPMVRKFIVDSVLHWVNDYSIDGFRFDLMGLIDLDTMLEIIKLARKEDDKFIAFGEWWAGLGQKGLDTCSSPYQSECTIGRGIQRGHQFGIFNEFFRDSVKGGNNKDTPGAGYATGATWGREDIFQGVMGSVYKLIDKKSFIDDPEETINYVACHDNYPLWDQITKHYGFEPGAPLCAADFKKCKKAHKLATGILLTAQGIAFIHAGDEFLRTKFGVYDSFEAGDDINKIRWDWKKDNLNVFNYYHGLIKLRKEHPAFRMSTKAEITDHFQGMEAPDGVVAFRLHDNAGATGDAWNNIMVVYNPHDEWKTVRNLGPQPWFVVADDNEAGTDIVKDGITKTVGEISLSPHSMSVMTNAMPPA